MHVQTARASHGACSFTSSIQHRGSKHVDELTMRLATRGAVISKNSGRSKTNKLLYKPDFEGQNSSQLQLKTAQTRIHIHRQVCSNISVVCHEDIFAIHRIGRKPQTAKHPSKEGNQHCSTRRAVLRLCEDNTKMTHLFNNKVTIVTVSQN